MVDTSLRLRLSAADLRSLMPEWPDALVNDYIEIFAELEQIINDLNQALTDIGTLFDDYGNLNSDLAGVRGLVAQLRAKVNRFGRTLEDLTARVPNLEQQAASAELAKIRARLTQSVRDYKAWLPAKGVLLTIEGQGAGNPILTNPYNVASVVRTGVGVYQVTISQETYFTRNVLTNSIITTSSIIAPLTTSYDMRTVVTGANTFEIRVYQLAVLGALVARNPFDLLAGDFLSVNGVFSINSTLPPR